MKIKLLLSVLTLALAGCVNTPEISTAKIAPMPEKIFSDDRGLRKMTAEELQSTLDGNTLRWGDGSEVFYNGSEIRSLKADGSPLIGAIDFSSGLHCRKWGGGSDKCSTVYNDGAGTLTFFVDGNPDSSGGYAQIVAGNPQQL